MINHTSKLTAVSLAVLMVLSVFAVPVAAAAQASVTADTGSTTVSPGSTFEVQYTITNDGDETGPGMLQVETPDGINIVSPEKQPVYPGIDAGAEETVTYTFEVTDGAVDGPITATATVGDDTDTATTDVTVDEDAPPTTEPPADDTEADRTFDSASDLEGQLVYSGQTVAVDVSGQGLDNDDSVQLRQVTGDDSSTTSSLLNVEDQMVVFETDDLDTDNYFLRGGNLDRQNSEFEIVVQDLTAEFADEEVDNAGSTTNELSIDSNLRNNYDVTFFVDGFSEDDYNDVFGDVAGASDAYENDDDEWVVDIEGAEGDHELDFNGIDADDYEFEVEVTDTTASDSADVSVIDVGEGELDLGEVTVEDQQGDIAEITVEFSGAATSGTLLIGDASNDGYQANVSVEDEDDGEVTVYFNTYLAGMSSSDVDADQIVWADTGDEDDVATLDNIDSEDQTLGDILDTGDYSLAVSTSDNVEDTKETPEAVGTLFLEERSTDSINLWTASTASDFEEVSDITDAVDDETLTEADTFAKGDAMVAQISATGLEGMVQADDEDVSTVFQDILANDDSMEGFDLTAEQLNPGSNTDPNEVNFADVDPTVLYDSDSDSYYVIASTNDLEAVLSGGDEELEDGDEFELNFDLKEQRLLDYDEGVDDETDEYESLTTEFSVEDRDAEFDVEEVDGDDYVVVNAEEGQTVSGTTNVAPGTELRIRTQGEDDARFVKEQTEVVVQADGSFNAEFDFSDRSVDEEFTATLRGHGMAENPSASGLIVEAVEPTTTEPTTTEPTTTEPTTTEPTTTEPTTTEETTEETTTPTQTPGFGIAVAMLALIGAALIALRRQN